MQDYESRSCALHCSKISHSNHFSKTFVRVCLRALCPMILTIFLIKECKFRSNSHEMRLKNRWDASLQTLAKLADKYADRPFSYLWAEGGAQPQLESLLEVGGYDTSKVQEGLNVPCRWLKTFSPSLHM